MVGESGVAFMQLGLGHGGGINNGLVVSKHVTLVTDGDSKEAKGLAKIDCLVGAGTSGGEFRTESSCFDGALLLGIPIDGSLVHKMQDPGDGAAGHEVVVQVGVDVVDERLRG